MSVNSIKSIWGPASTQPAAGFDSMGTPKIGGSNERKTQFANAIKSYLSEVDDLQQSSDMSIKDLLSGKSEDIASVAAAAAKADASFRLLVGVRNKLIEAYKQTMNMPL
ncbi:MAG: flagellar hook-basal body complex protein FliE [Planctomycetes bacterium RBG_16_55_9]|nr:MAG: flagellar hook-basal body complex protein FliE [Planctomycetes bacterium RBG_16_55_9]